MKLLDALLWGSSMTLSTYTTQAAEVTVNVTGIDTDRGGDIIVMLFNEDGFPKDHQRALMLKSEPATEETLTLSFSLDTEAFAIKVLHDENSDGKVTKNWTKIYPKEGLGFSNHQRIGLTGPPSYKKPKIVVYHATINQTILIRYP